MVDIKKREKIGGKERKETQLFPGGDVNAPPFRMRVGSSIYEDDNFVENLRCSGFVAPTVSCKAI